MRITRGVALMEFRHLRYFIAVAEEQNLSRAAKRLNISQPPLSRQMRDLEEALGVSLFERSAKSIRLTEAGRIFLVEAKEILQRVKMSVDLVQSIAKGKRGKLRVGYAASPTIEILRRTLQSFHEDAPQIKVDLRDMTSQAMLRALRENEIDVALTVALSPKDFDGLNFEILMSVPIYVAFNKKHIFRNANEISYRDIAQQPLVTFTREEHPEAHAAIKKILSPYTSMPNIAGEYDTIGSLITAVEARCGVALVLPSVSHIAGDRISLRPVSPPILVPIAIVYRKGANSAAATKFIQAAITAKANLMQATGTILSL